jgi:DNA-binding MarR family transcriptional regulator
MSKKTEKIQYINELAENYKLEKTDKNFNKLYYALGSPHNNKNLVVNKICKDYNFNTEDTSDAYLEFMGNLHNVINYWKKLNFINWAIVCTKRKVLKHKSASVYCALLEMNEFENHLTDEESYYYNEFKEKLTLLLLGSKFDIENSTYILSLMFENDYTITEISQKLHLDKSTVSKKLSNLYSFLKQRPETLKQSCQNIL